MPTWEHKKSGYKLVIRDLRQIDLEKFEKELQRLGVKGLFEHHGAVVRSAYTVDWITDPPPFDVAEADPRLVRWMAAKLDGHYADLNTLPIDPE